MKRRRTCPVKGEIIKGPRSWFIESGVLAAVVVAGSLAVIIAVVDLITIYAQMGPDASRGFIRIHPGFGLCLLLAVAVATIAVGILIIFKYSSHAPVQDQH